MSKTTACGLFALLLLGGCAHIKQTPVYSESLKLPENDIAHQVLCSAHGADVKRIKLNVETSNTKNPKLALRKVIELPYFANDHVKTPPSTLRHILLWRDDIMVLAEVAPIETGNLFTVAVTTFSRVKNRISQTSSAYLVMGLCHDGELRIGGQEGEMTLRARLELLGTAVSNK